MKNAFYLIKKALFVLQIFKFLFFSLPFQFPDSKGQTEGEYTIMSTIDLHQLTDVIFRITKKLCYNPSSNLVR